jgi:Tol biopolymer transport system component
MDLAKGADPVLLTSSDSKSRFLGTILSPDGQRIAWYDDFYAQTLQKEINGGLATVLANCTQPSFSPDGSHLVCKGRDGSFQVVKTSDGSVQSRLNTGVDGSVLPAWSPTRQEIVFAGLGADRSASIYRLNLGTGEVIPLAAAHFENYAPSWSPDGEWITFQSAEHGMPSEIWVMDREGGQQRKITFNSGWSRGPSFSPDGQWLAFVSDLAGSIGPDSGEAFAISLVTGEQVQLTQTGGMVYDWRVSWGK